MGGCIFIKEAVSMTSGARSKWRERENRRAAKIHEIFYRIAESGLPSKGKFRLARKLAGSGKFFNSFERWEAIFLAWRKSPCPETVRRKWRGVSPETSAGFVPAVKQFALAARITLRAAHGRLGLPISYNTVFRHCPKDVRVKINQLAAAHRAQERISGQEKSFLLMLTKGKRP